MTLTSVSTKLAVRGGTPVRNNWLPYGRQTIDEQDIAAVAEVLRSEWLTQGPNIDEFEKAVAKYCSVNHAVAVNSGTAALHAAYHAVGLGKGDHIVMPGMSFAATANAALYLGAEPVFCDIESDTGNVDVHDVARKITAKTKAIVGVDFSGQPCNLAKLRAIADDRKLPLIIDGAHSIGATYASGPAAQIADLTTFSFHPVKAITTGEGGMIVTNNDEFAKRMKRFRTHGIEKNSKQFLHESHGAWYHEMQELGFNYRITEFQAALGLSQLGKLDSFLKRRREIAKKYDQAFATLENFDVLAQRKYGESAYHLYPVLVKRDRKFAVEALHGENIGVQIHYIPIFRHPFYEQSFAKPECPKTEAFYERVINLPIFPLMTDSDVSDVISAVRKVDQALTEQA